VINYTLLMKAGIHGAAAGTRTDDVLVADDVPDTSAETSPAAVTPYDAAAADDVTEFCAVPDGAPPQVGPDQVDEFIEGWRRERPDLDSETLVTLGCFARMKWLAKNLAATAEQVIRRHGLNAGEFDVLAALRQSGPPCTLIPSQLSALLMTSRAGMTNRLDRLEAAGFIERTLDPADRRSFLVRLTDKGRAAIDAAVTEHAQIVNRFSAALSPDQRRGLDEALRALLRALP
jgi:DNA-binding MarR family transcriptional regulator